MEAIFDADENLFLICCSHPDLFLALIICGKIDV